MTKITRTRLAMRVICKCGSCIACTMLYGGIAIDEEFMDTVSQIANNGGLIDIVDAVDNPISLSECKCK